MATLTGRIASLSFALVMIFHHFVCERANGENSPWCSDLGLKADAQALLVFKKGLQDSKGVLTSWDYHQTPCSWQGVECGTRMGAANGTRVVGLELKDAMLNGFMSAKLGELSELESLLLVGNNLQGVIPREFCNCRRLIALDLSRNRLHGPIPVCIPSLLPNLVEFSASENQLSGSLERLFDGCDSLKLLDLSQNRLTGVLPKNLRLCTEIVEVRFDSNYLVGNIPSEYGALRNLETLHLQNNVLDGHLPEDLRRCTKMRSLNVAENLIMGEIPPSFVQLQELRDFDVARNRLRGRIPPGKWLRRGSFFRGNDGLCGSPLTPCKDDEPEPVQGLRRSLITKARHRRSAGARWGLGIAVGVVSGMVFGVLLALLTRVVLTVYSKTEDLKKPIIFNKKITPNMLAFLDKEDALAECRVLGEGGNGKVYQVQLQDDLVVAIKCVRNRGLDADDPISHDLKQIRAELETLGFIRHRNLVQLLAYIFKSDSHLLVYEYMPGGSLQDVLQQMAQGDLTLSWPERHRILCHVAQGLAYLHNESLGSSIVHRDLKPGNILLADGYEAKLGDFGLAAIVPLKATHATTDVLAGTIGFIAPEYHQTMRYSDKSDVFSYGVVIAQLVTGRNPTDQFVVENGGSIGQWLEACLQSSHGMEAIDPALLGSGYEAEILLALKIAVFCTNLEPQQRPKSTEVLKMLLQIRNPDPVPVLGGNLSHDSADSDTPIMSSGPLKFPDSNSTSSMSASY